MNAIHSMTKDFISTDVEFVETQIDPVTGVKFEIFNCPDGQFIGQQISEDTVFWFCWN